MKKVFYLVVIALTTLLIVSCGGKKAVTHESIFESISIGYQQDDSSLSVTKDIQLPITVEHEAVTLTWTSANPAVISNEGKVTRPKTADQTVLLILEVDINGVKEEKSFFLTVKADPQAADKVRVTFDTQGGSTIAPVDIEKESLLSAPTAPTKAGYRFEGWFKEAAGINAWNFATDKVTEDITLYAKWLKEAVSYTVTFESNGGSVVNPINVVEGNKLSKPADPTKAGFDFLGWYTDSDLDVLFDFDNQVITTSITLYAKWAEEAPKYTITFESNGGSAVDSILVRQGEKALKPTNPTKAEHTFEGWFKDDALLEVFDFSVEVVTDDMTLYAKWKALPKNFTVTFNTNGGTDIQSQVVVEGNKVIKPEDPTKEEFIFVDWYSDEGLENVFDFETIIEDSMTLYARWKPVTKYYTVTFNAVGGSSVEALVVEENTLIPKPDNPTRLHYIFKGWYTTNSYDVLWDFDVDVIEADITLYALWHPEDVDPETPIYKVTFEVDGGTPVDDQFVAENRAIEHIPTTEKEEHVFEGWFKDAAFNEAWGEFDLVVENITLYAKWRQLPPKLPTPIDMWAGQTPPESHLAVTAYEFPEGDNGGFMGYGVVFVNNTTNMEYVWEIDVPYKEGGNYYYTEANLLAAGIVLTYGDYNIFYYAKGNNVTTRDSDRMSTHVSFSIEKPPLAKPTLSIVDDALTWADVEHATSYEVYINDELQVGNESPFDLSVITEPGIYQIKVVALADTHKSSEATIEYVVSNPEAPALDTPTNLVQDGFNLTWDIVEHAIGYSITINEITKQSVVNQFDLSLFDIGDQTVTVSVVALGDANNYSNSLAAEKEVTLGTLLPRLDAMTAGDMNHAYLKDSVDNGHYKTEFYSGHAVFNQAGFTENKAIKFVLRQNGVYIDEEIGSTTTLLLHTPNSKTDFYGRNNLTYGETYTIEIILMADPDSGVRDSLPFATEFVFKAPY